MTKLVRLVISVNCPMRQIASRNSAFERYSASDLRSRSIASTGLSAYRAPRSFFTFSYSCWLKSFSSLRVPVVWMLMAGKMRFSARPATRRRAGL